MSLSSIVFIFCIINVTKQIPVVVDHIYFPDRIKSKKTAINSINEKDKKCFQYAVTVALNHEKIKKDPQK